MANPRIEIKEGNFSKQRIECLKKIIFLGQCDKEDISKTFKLTLQETATFIADLKKMQKCLDDIGFEKDHNSLENFQAALNIMDKYKFSFAEKSFLINFCQERIKSPIIRAFKLDHIKTCLAILPFGNNLQQKISDQPEAMTLFERILFSLGKASYNQQKDFLNLLLESPALVSSKNNNPKFIIDFFNTFKISSFITLYINQILLFSPNDLVDLKSFWELGNAINHFPHLRDKVVEQSQLVATNYALIITDATSFPTELTSLVLEYLTSLPLKQINTFLTSLEKLSEEKRLFYEINFNLVSLYHFLSFEKPNNSSTLTFSETNHQIVAAESMMHTINEKFKISFLETSEKEQKPTFNADKNQESEKFLLECLNKTREIFPEKCKNQKLFKPKSSFDIFLEESRIKEFLERRQVDNATLKTLIPHP